MTEKQKQQNPFKTCLVPLLDALGWQGEKRFIFESIPVMSREHMTEEDLLTTMAHLGYNCNSFVSKLKHIDPRLMPCFFINHKGVPSVLLHYGEKSIFTFNGMTGKYEEVNDIRRSGKVLFFKPTHREKTTLQDRQPHWFANVAARFKINIFALIAVSLALALLTLLSPLFIMFVYDQVLYSDSIKTLGLIAWGVGIYIVAFGGATYYRNAITRLTSVRLGNIIGNQVIRRILYLPLSYTEIASLGSQLARIRDFLSIQNFVGGNAFSSLCELPFIALLILVLYLLGGSIIIVPVTAIAIFIISYFIMVVFVSKINSSIAGAGAERQELLLEILTNFRAIKNTGKRDLWYQRFKELSANWAYQAFRNARINCIISVYSQLLVSISALITIYLGVLKVIAGQMTPGALMAAMILVWRILGPLRNGFSVLSQMTRLKKSIQQLNKLMNMPLEVSTSGQSAVTRQLSGRITMSQVSIRYLPEAAPALLGINLQVEKGECLVVCGHEGAGKSTLLKLIMGLYMPQAGRISIDDINVRQIAPVLLRKSISFVPQQPTLFPGTLYDNLMLGNPAASDADIDKALLVAGIKQAVSNLPEELQTVVSMRNINSFSMPFKKKLALAMALLRNSKILILDEATKGLSKDDFNHSLSRLKEMKKSHTLIIVTDQRALFDLADNVLWLDKGRIRQFDTAEKVKKEYFKAAREAAKVE